MLFHTEKNLSWKGKNVRFFRQIFFDTAKSFALYFPPPPETVRSRCVAIAHVKLRFKNIKLRLPLFESECCS